jgi:hypothetical protein
MYRRRIPVKQLLKPYPFDDDGLSSEKFPCQMPTLTKSSLLPAAALCFFMVMSASFTCVKPVKTVSIDSIHYFNPGRILITPGDIKDSSIRLKLHDGEYVFYKSGPAPSGVFRADKDARSFYQLINVDPVAVNDTALIATIRYQAFDKQAQTNISKVFRLKESPVPLRMMKSFSVLWAEYNKVFPVASK